jgi:drug/metabolite transporter (DMT)-like permease
MEAFEFYSLTLFSALGLACGNILETLGLKKSATVGAVFKSKLWYGGLALSALATLGYYAAMALFPLSSVQPMMALNPAITALFGWLWLKEKMTPRLGAAVGCVFVGLALSGTLPDEQAVLQGELRFWGYCGAVAFLTILVYFLGKRKELRYATGMGAGFGLSAVVYKQVTLGGELPGLLDGRILLFVALYGFGFVSSQMALKTGRALFVVPFSAGLGLLIPTLAGIFAFGEPVHIIKGTGLALVAAGTFLFVNRS